MKAISFIPLYFKWHFLEFPKELFKGISNFVKFGIRMFSVPELLRTLFSPWRRLTWSPPRGFDIFAYFEVMVSNFISRMLGFTLRIFLIFVAILYEIFVIVFGTLILTSWYLLPAITIFSFAYGIFLLFKI